MKLKITLLLMATMLSLTGCEVASNSTTSNTGVTTSTTTTTTASILPDRIVVGTITDMDTIAGNNYATLYFADGLSVEVTTASLSNFSSEFYQFFETGNEFTFSLQNDLKNANLYDLVDAAPGVNINSVNVNTTTAGH
jgi:ABC-type Fe3+-hydroxamate transport system substrate-binding protein